MNKKGFILMETLVVTMFVLLTFSILYSNAVPLLGRYEEIAYFNDIDATYDLYHIENFLTKDPNYSKIFNENEKILTCNDGDIYNQDACNTLFDFLGIDSTNDQLVFLKTDFKKELMDDTNISAAIKDYLNYVEIKDNILILEKDEYVSFINIEEPKVIEEPKPDEPYIPPEEEPPLDDKPDDTVTTDTLLKEKVSESIKNSTCNPKIDNYNPLTGATTTYLSGNNDCINFNYVWYSGKLWRIVSINQEGEIKLITEDPITNINFGSSSIYSDTSWVYEWLNEDFLDTLYNYKEIIVEDTNWNATGDTFENNEAVDPDLKSDKVIVKGNVGLLNLFEYYESYLNIKVNNTIPLNYLNYNQKNVSSWWTLTNYNNGSVYVVSKNSIYHSDPTDFEDIVSTSDVRPSIVLKKDILIKGGDGTKENPYRLKGDIERPKDTNTPLNKRVSGEYVMFAGKVYRIVDIENNLTKLVATDVLRNSEGEAVYKLFSDSNLYGNYEIKVDDLWDYYLNNTWYNRISKKYRDMLVKGTYYLGIYDYHSYKTTICNEVSDATTKACEKTSKVFKGYVGLPRVGEMFTSSVFNTDDDWEDYWLITPYDSNDVLLNTGDGLYVSPLISAFGELYTARPTITLSSDVLITAGNGRSPETAFRITLE